QVGRHEVDVVGQILPGAGDAVHFGLAAELAFSAHLARHAADFRGKSVEAVHHRVDGFLELQNLALDVHGDLPGQISERDRGGHFSDVADLGGKVRWHRVDGLDQILTGAGYAGNYRLSAEAAFGADFARESGGSPGNA